MTPEERLEALYRQAQEALARAIEETPATGSPREYERRLQRQINATLAALGLSTEAWTAENMRRIYEDAKQQAAQAVADQYRAAGQTPPPKGDLPTALDTNAISLTSRNLNSDLTATIDHVGRVLRDEVRQAGVGATLRKLKGAETVRQAKNDLLRMLKDRGIPAIEYTTKAGEKRYIQLESYAKLVARSTTREATNTASINYSVQIGNDLVKISAHFGSCPICLPYEGRVYSVSGTNPHYPALYSTPFSRQYKNFHPNCAHVVTPWVERLHSAEEVDAMRRYSNRSFDIEGEDWTPEQRRAADRSLAAYEKRQKANRQLYDDRKQFQRYRAVLGPGEAPPTFATFRRLKYNNSEKFQYWQLDYRRRNKLLENPGLSLPNAGTAKAADEKFTGYLFNKDNADGWAKGQAFTSRLGYSAENWEDLRKEILLKAGRYPATTRGEDPFGVSYTQRLVLYGAKGKPANVTVGWKTLENDTWLTTAYIEEVKGWKK